MVRLVVLLVSMVVGQSTHASCFCSRSNENPPKSGIGIGKKMTDKECVAACEKNAQYHKTDYHVFRYSFTGGSNKAKHRHIGVASSKSQKKSAVSKKPKTKKK